MRGKQSPPLKEGWLCLKEIRVNKNIRKTKVVLQVRLWRSLPPSALGTLPWASTTPGNKSWPRKHWFVWGSLGTTWWTNGRRCQEPALVWYTAHQGWGQVSKHLKVCGCVGAESSTTWLHAGLLVRKCWKGQGKDHTHPRGETRSQNGPGNHVWVWSLEPRRRTQAACKVSFRLRHWPQPESWRVKVTSYVCGYLLLPQLSLSSWNVKFRLRIVGGLSALVMVNFLPSHLKLPDRQTIFFSSFCNLLF